MEATGRGSEEGVAEARETLRLCDWGVAGAPVRMLLPSDFRLVSPLEAERGLPFAASVVSAFDRFSFRDRRVGKRFTLLDIVLEVLDRLLEFACWNFAVAFSVFASSERLGWDVLAASLMTTGFCRTRLPVALDVVTAGI